MQEQEEEDDEEGKQEGEMWEEAWTFQIRFWHQRRIALQRGR